MNNTKCTYTSNLHILVDGLSTANIADFKPYHKTLRL